MEKVYKRAHRCVAHAAKTGNQCTHRAKLNGKYCHQHDDKAEIVTRSDQWERMLLNSVGWMAGN